MAKENTGNYSWIQSQFAILIISWIFFFMYWDKNIAIDKPWNIWKDQCWYLSITRNSYLQGTRERRMSSLGLLQIVKMDKPWRWDPEVNQAPEGTEASCDWDGGISCLWVTDVQDPPPTRSGSPRASEVTWPPGFSWLRFILPSHWYMHSMCYNSVPYIWK